MVFTKKDLLLIKKLEGFVKEELESSRVYARLGFKRQANDEFNHSKFFKKKISELKKKSKV